MIKDSLHRFFTHNDTQVFKRYVFVGLASNSTIYLIYLAITFLGMDHKLAMSILYVIGTFISYFGNKTWTFSYKGKISSSFIKFFLVYLAGYLTNLFLLFYFVDLLQYPHQLVQIFSIFLIAVLIFLLSKFFVFHSALDDS
jgi:putative flippase GtrA